MERMNRRLFIRTGMAGMAGLTLAGAAFPNVVIPEKKTAMIDLVQLGKTGLQVPRIALGTGSVGGNQQSNQTRLGKEGFVGLARHAWDRGIRFFDMADSYGSHTFVREVLNEVPREKSILMTKIWTTDTSWQKCGEVGKTLDRFRMETGSDYFDIVLLHCLMRGNWQEEKKEFMDGLSKAKENGLVRAVGVSCHNWDAMVKAAEDPWVDVILARINPFGAHMDGTPEAVSELLLRARKNGKGIIGMKIFGNGDFTSPGQRDQSINFAISGGTVHCMTLGLESAEQVDDAVEKVIQAVRTYR